jgi:competence protein ComEA
MQSIPQKAPRRRAAGLRAGLLGICLAAGLAAAFGGAGSVQAGSEGVVNVNTAGVDELVRLPGIGESKARAIVDFRKERGAFKSVEQLREVKGIGDAALERIRPHVAIDGKTTLN